ncbi:hypothetical protein SDC9_101305 [bioreactor metagenome]|uniref:Uncharacterized protein n=1 Tax=bioreactor metagenome TaxID=1076179 RepID=A0A645ANA7_9ZZZZ
MQAGEAQFVESLVGGTLAAEFGRQVGQFLGVAALDDPLGAQRRQTGADVDLRRRVGIRAGTIINVDRRILLAAEAGRRIGLRDFAHRHPEVRPRAFDVNLARIRQRLDGGLVHVGVGGEEGVFGVHECSVRMFSGVRRARSDLVPVTDSFPYVGMTRSGSKGISQPSAVRVDTPNESGARYWKHRQNARKHGRGSRFPESGRNKFDKPVKIRRKPTGNNPCV